VANLVAMKSADAALVWNAVWYLRKDKLDRIEIDKYLPKPHVDGITSATGKRYVLAPVRVSICSLKCSSNPQEARKFMKFATSARARTIFENHGFRVPANLRRQEYCNGKKQ